MTSIQCVAGHAGGPTLGTNFFQSEVLRNAVVHFIIVNNIPENGLDPDPSYSFTSVDGKISRGNNNWFSEDTLIVLYTKCSCS